MKYDAEMKVFTEAYKIQVFGELFFSDHTENI